MTAAVPGNQPARHSPEKARVHPEPVRKGKALTVTGKLTRLDQYGWNGDYVAAANARVAIYFKKRGMSTWVYAGAGTSNGKGIYTKKFTAKLDGYWQGRFNGNASYVAIRSAADYVDVR